MYRVLTLILVILPLLALAAHSTPTLDVTGSGVVYVQPDRIRVIVGFERSGDNLQALLQDVMDSVDRLRTALRRMGLKEESIATYHLSITPVYDYEAKPPRIVGYNVVYLIRVEISDAKLAGKVIDTAFNAGVNRLDEVSYFLSEEKFKEAYVQALLKAVADAKLKARKVAEAAGVKLGRIVRISVGELPYEVERYMVKGFAVRAAAPIMPLEIKVVATVDLSYEIIARP